MTKPRKSKSKKGASEREDEDIETDPGAWGRFKHAVDAAVTGGPKHRAPPKLRKGRVKKGDRQLKKEK